MILILSTPKDIHARHIANLLAAGGHAVRHLDSAALGGGYAGGPARLSHPIGWGTPVWTLPDGEQVELSQVRTVWMRRPRPPALPDFGNDVETARFCRREWAETLDGVMLGLGARFVNAPQADAASVKPRQLAEALRCGLTIPETLVTSDPDAAAAFVHRHNGDVIHKAMSSPANRLLETRVWRPDDAADLYRLPFAPAMFQRRVHGPADLRITCVGQKLFTARIATESGRSEVDSRLDHDVAVDATSLPDGLAARLLEFMAAMGLVYGTIDLKIDTSGAAVFLEVNPQGQFLYIEIQTGLPISIAMAELLAEQE